MNRKPLPPPSAALIAAEAEAHHGLALPPDRAGVVAGEVGRTLAAAERVALRREFEDEPAHFPRALRAAAR